jgi:hypothetical protein
MNIAFWNINNKDLYGIIIELCLENDIDIIGIAEGNDSNCWPLLKNGYELISKNSKVQLFMRYNQNIIKSCLESERYSIVEVKLPIIESLTISCCHLVDKYSSPNVTQARECMKYLDDIVEFEKSTGTENTIVIGDFNINPYESAMVGAGFFNATNDKLIAQKKTRTVKGTCYKYFYNPMWKLYANDQRPLGTYYYIANDHESVHWNIIDNMLIRPCIIPFYSDSSLRILGKAGKDVLLTKHGFINKNKYSDHLPFIASFLF